MTKHEAVKKFILDELLPKTSSDAVGYTDPLIESGIVDSFGIMSLISFVEREYRIQLASDDLMPDNFKDIASIASLIERKLS